MNRTAWTWILLIAWFAASCAVSPTPPPPEPAAPSEEPAMEPAEGAETSSVEPAMPAEAETPAEGEAVTPAEAEAVTPAPEVLPTPAEEGGKAQDLLERLSLADQARMAAAQEFLKQGQAAFEAMDYARAEDGFRRAWAEDPGLKDAQMGLARSLLMQGKREKEALAIMDLFSRERRVKAQQELEDTKRLLAAGRQALDENDPERARRNVVQAIDKLNWFEFEVDVTDLREKAEALDREVQQALVSRSTEARRAIERRVEDQIEEDRARAERATLDRIRSLRKQLDRALSDQDYEQVIELSQVILSLNSQDIIAAEALEQAKRMKHAQSVMRVIRDTEESLELGREAIQTSGVPHPEPFRFPEVDFWRRVQKRETEFRIGEVEESAEVRAIKRVIETLRITIDFDKKPLSDVVDFIRKASGMNILVDNEVDATQITVELRLERALLRDALDLIMDHTGLKYTFREGTLLITVPEKAKGIQVFRIYPVTDILNKIRNFPGPRLDIRSPDEEEDTEGGGGFAFGAAEEEKEVQIKPEELIDLIRESTGGDEVWTEETALEPHRGQLLVQAPIEVQAKVAQVLAELRKDSDLFVVVKARFIDVTDDFMEDIGVDYRALGVQKNWGLAYGSRINDNRTGAQDLGFVNRGNPTNPSLQDASDRLAGRVQNILDGFTGIIRGERLYGGQDGLSGLTLQATLLDPYQINAILRAVQEKADTRSVTAPLVTAHNGQRVFVSVVTQRSYIADYELVSGGTGWTLTEVADPIVQTNEEGVVLDVVPTVSADRRYITIDVRPTLATLIGGVISTILINLGTTTAAAWRVPIGLPKMSIQRTWTSVTVPDGGTVLLGGLRTMNEFKYKSTLPILGRIPILNLFFGRTARLSEKRSLVILITAKTIDLRNEEARKFGE
ncbi:MAG: hypothetical protein JXP34_13490 [Planctomycetes bacterium]|nr:hypothetical protein [Planctomycetota bacterium]